MRSMIPGELAGKSARSWKLLARVGALAIAGMVVLAGLVINMDEAKADPAPAPRLVMGNVTTCAAAGLSGTVLFGEGDDYPAPPTAAGDGEVSADGITLDVTINAGFTASGIVVKGGPNSNVYDGPFVGPTTVEGMISPPNPGGQTPEISHWFVCGAASVPATPAPSGGAETGGGGSYTTAVLGLGALALAGGAGVVLFRIRRRDELA